MSEKSYIQPTQLSATEVAQVLAALNSTENAEDLAAAVEFPYELDIGVRIAQRIINRREALGGTFSNIQQLADVPLVGPERFTEIVAALTGQALPWADGLGQTPTQLRAELRALREMVANLQHTMGARYRIELRALSPGGFLGQEQLLRARVVEAATGKPKANAHLTLTCNWGNLHSQLGFAFTKGRGIHITTDLQGEAKIRYTPPTYELLHEAQRYALESALGRLNRQAATPSATADGFEYIVEQYNLEPNSNLREAIDIYIREQQAQLVNPINRNTWMNTWQYREVLLSAYVQEALPDSDVLETAFSTSVDSMATIVLRLKDWVPPWYQALLGNLSAANNLDSELEAISNSTEDKSLLLNRMLSSIHNFTAKQRGIAGELAIQELSSRYITGFLAQGMGQLPPETQLSLFPFLNIAARTTQKAGRGTLEAAAQNRMDLRQQINTKVIEIDNLNNRFSVLNSRMDDVDRQVIDIEANLNLRIDDTLLTLNQRIDLNVDRIEADFDARIDGVERTVQGYNDNFAAFSNEYATFKVNYGKFEQDRAGITQNINRVAFDLEGLSSNYTTFKNDMTRQR